MLQMRCSTCTAQLLSVMALRQGFFSLCSHICVHIRPQVALMWRQHTKIVFKELIAAACLVSISCTSIGSDNQKRGRMTFFTASSH